MVMTIASVLICSVGLGAASAPVRNPHMPLLQRAEKPEPRCWTEAKEIQNAGRKGRQAPPLPDRFNGADVRQTAVVLKLCVDSDGRVARTIVLVSSGNDAVDDFYREELSKWTFDPPIRRGKRVVSVSTVAINWNSR